MLVDFSGFRLGQLCDNIGPLCIGFYVFGQKLKVVFGVEESFQCFCELLIGELCPLVDVLVYLLEVKPGSFKF